MTGDRDKLLLELVRLLSRLFLSHDAPNAPLRKYDFRHAVARDDRDVCEHPVRDYTDKHCNN